MGVAEFAESFVPEDAVLTAARSRALEIGVEPVSPATGAVLRLARRYGPSTHRGRDRNRHRRQRLYLLRGLRPTGCSRASTPKPRPSGWHGRHSTQTAVPTSRARLINGRALDVLPRLTDGAYDIVFCASDRREYPDFLPQVIRLVRPGGVIVFDGAANASDPSARDAEAGAMRKLVELVREDGRLAPAVLPVGSGLLAAIVPPIPPKTPEPAAEMDIGDFYDGDPSPPRVRRRFTFGDGWTTEADQHSTYRANYVRDTGELYVVREPHPGGLAARFLDQLDVDQADVQELTVEVLGRFPDDAAALQSAAPGLAGCHDQARQPDLATRALPRLTAVR